MSKIILILLISISIQYVFSQTNETDIPEKVYYYIKDFFAGMANDEKKSLCIGIIDKKKDDLIRFIKPIVDSSSDAQKLLNVLIESVMKIITIHGFAKNCKILNVIIFYNKLTIMNEIINLSNTIVKSSKEIAALFNKEFANESIFKKIGKLAKKLLNINVK